MSLLTVAEICKRLGVTRPVIIKHIREGRLAAMNVGSGLIKPEYRVSEDDYLKFLQSRMTTKARPLASKRRRPAKPNRKVIEFF